MINRFRYVIFALIWISISGCGTDTGNPMSQDSLGQIIQNLSSVKIMNKACEKLSFCHQGYSFQECEETFLKLENVHPKLGLPVEQYAQYENVIQAEQVGSIIPIGEASQRCMDEVEALGCGDSRVVNGVRDPSELICPSCMGVFEN